MTEDGMLVAVGFPPEIELKGRKHRTTRRDGRFHQSFTIHYLLFEIQSPPFPIGIGSRRPNPIRCFIRELEKIDVTIPKQDVVSKLPFDVVP